ncbi:MAG: glycosyltransferase family 39 protein [Ignavibacteria bacterium]|nr:glycosyltransferase family 39 protein [Ignavibacteria bacterium]
MQEEEVLTTEISQTDNKSAWSAVLSNTSFHILVLLVLKFSFQFILLSSGYRWLSADDFCRTVKSYEWLQNPVVNSGVWLTPHFWINGAVMYFVKDLFAAALIVNFLFSALTVPFFYKAIQMAFDQKTAFFSTLIFCFFPFQVWLSISGLPESVFFFFVITGIYFFMKWKFDGELTIYLFLSAFSFAFSNGFRYEGWLFSAAFVMLTMLDILRERKLTKKIVKNIFISLISFTTIAWWLIQNYVDHGNVFFFAEETTKIFKEFNTAGFFQRLVQYPTFIFFIAPVTTFFALKSCFETIKAPGITPAKIFLLFNILELSLLMIQGILGTGGTNMISRYIVINALLFVPFAIDQAFEFKKPVAISLLGIMLIVNIVWSFYYPQPFREDTFEVGRLLRDIESKAEPVDDRKIYFEEVEGYFDVFAVQALSNNPAKFVLGNFPTEKSTTRKMGRRKNQPTEEELNILELRDYLSKNKIKLAIVKSEGYSEKLKKLSFKNEDIGDYKLFYVDPVGSTVNDSSASILEESALKPGENPDLVNFGKLLGLRNYSIDNTNFGLNPQTVVLTWGAVDPYLLDSIDFENMEFDRYLSVVSLRSVETDSTVFNTYTKIFSDRNVEELLEENSIRNIVVLKPFALLHYSKKYSGSPFEGGVYYVDVRLRDNKTKNDLFVYRGDSLMKPDTTNFFTRQDNNKQARDTAKSVAKRVPAKAKEFMTKSYTIGTIIAMFPDTDFNKIVGKSSDEIYRMLMRNGIQVFFSQRYQGDQFLNWVFNYF